MIAGFSCRVCDGPHIVEVEDFKNLPRITSDCKPFRSGGRLGVCSGCGTAQKLIDDEWRSEIAEIYGSYDIYYQSDGVEQAVFDSQKGEMGTRSSVLVNNVMANSAIPAEASYLDIGCGNGAFLSAVSAARPNSNLFGFELSDRHRPALHKIPGFRNLFVEKFEAIEGQYNLVSMIHSLEHFEFPEWPLEQAKKSVDQDGTIFIQVPDIGATPFDLIIADHATHFSQFTLRYLLEKSGIAVDILSNSWVTKELSVLGKVAGENDAAVTAIPSDGENALRKVKSDVSWLKETTELAREAAVNNPSFGLFGTSISAIWLYGFVSDSVSFFVDEDPARVGGSLFGKPIYHPNDVPKGSGVFVALIPQVAEAVSKRLSKGDIDWICPGTFQ